MSSKKDVKAKEDLDNIKKKENETNEIDMADGSRVLSKVEYANLSLKIEAGAFPVSYFRNNLFYPTASLNAKDASKVKEGFEKIIYEDDKLKVTVDKYLHQRHKDVLTVLFTNSYSKSSPQTNGAYYIYSSLAHIAREIGYSSPSSASARVKKLLNELRSADIKIIQKRKEGTIESVHKLLGAYVYSSINGRYRIEIPSETAKFHILEYAVEIPPETSKKMLSIPYTQSRTKAVITFLLSNKILKNGIGINTVMDMMGVDTAKTRYTFKKEILENKDLLCDYDISYDIESGKLFLKKEMVFQRAVSEEEIIKSFAKDGTKQKDTRFDKIKADKDIRDDYEIKDLNYLMLKFKNKYLRIAEHNYLVKDFIYGKDNDIKQILIEADFLGLVKKIPTKTMNIEELERKLYKYNLEYFNSMDENREVEF